MLERKVRLIIAIVFFKIMMHALFFGGVTSYPYAPSFEVGLNWNTYKPNRNGLWMHRQLFPDFRVPLHSLASVHIFGHRQLDTTHQGSTSKYIRANFLPPSLASSCSGNWTTLHYCRCDPLFLGVICLGLYNLRLYRAG
ncbi:hypothetical protein C8R41DRAFT_627265 [Lentinula lateritia]|uniref:Uncharacterized protein n=1 Tax=Lentinula lateritia TaxID=40482 RepID=A0ABQ8V7I2_9AGAR|nr:hypothetical protein C8R41DRAFT_627265 [Lentinula lateritia]